MLDVLIKPNACQYFKPTSSTLGVLFPPKKRTLAGEIVNARLGQKANIVKELIEKIEDRRYGPRISRSKSATRVRVSLVPTLGNSVYQFAEVATKLSIKDVFNAFRALTH